MLFGICYYVVGFFRTLQGFNATLTEPVNADGRVDQFKEMELNLHPELEEPLKKLCDDPRTTVVVVSGSHRSVLDKVTTVPCNYILIFVLFSQASSDLIILQNFEDYDMWLAAEHGVFLRTANKKWMQNLTDNINLDWIESVKVCAWLFMFFFYFGKNQEAKWGGGNVS